LSIRGEIHLDAMSLDDTLKKGKKKECGNKASECLLIAKQNNEFLMKNYETKLIMPHF